MKYLLLILSISIFTCCDKYVQNTTDGRMKIQNNTNKSILYVISASYPDTLDFVPFGCSSGNIGTHVKENSQRTVNMRNVWENVFEKNDSSTLMFYIYDKETAVNLYEITNHNCDTLYKRPDLILKRYDVTLDYLNQHNWTIIYP